MIALSDSAVLLFDFDGTLSDVVDDPAAAQPRPGVVDHLVGLARRYLRVGVISGRPVSFLVDHLPPQLYFSGLYGMEEAVGGVVGAPAEYRRWEPLVVAAVADLRAAVAADPRLTAAEVEDKGLSVTVHYRRNPELGGALDGLVGRIAEERGLEVRPARMSIELHPPVPTDKGMVLRHLVASLGGVEAVIFVGDDVGDLPAFEALSDLRDAGLTTVAVAVASTEMDPRMRDRADLVIADTDVELLLRALHHGAGVDG